MRRKYGTNSTRDNPSEEAAFELGVVYSAVKDELVAFAAKEGSPYSFADVAARVSKLLQAEALREQLRDSDYLSEMRQNGSGHHRGRPPQSGRYELAAEAAVFQGSSATRPLRQLSAKARKAISKAQRARWARFHAERAKHGVAVGFEKPAKKKRKFRQTAATRAKISAARKAYWAAKRKGGAAA